MLPSHHDVEPIRQSRSQGPLTSPPSTLNFDNLPKSNTVNEMCMYTQGCFLAGSHNEGKMALIPCDVALYDYIHSLSPDTRGGGKIYSQLTSHLHRVCAGVGISKSSIPSSATSNPSQTPLGSPPPTVFDLAYNAVPNCPRGEFPGPMCSPLTRRLVHKIARSHAVVPIESGDLVEVEDHANANSANFFLRVTADEQQFHHVVQHSVGAQSATGANAHTSFQPATNLDDTYLITEKSDGVRCILVGVTAAVGEGTTKQLLQNSKNASAILKFSAPQVHATHEPSDPPSMQAVTEYFPTWWLTDWTGEQIRLDHDLYDVGVLEAAFAELETNRNEDRNTTTSAVTVVQTPQQQGTNAAAGDEASATSRHIITATTVMPLPLSKAKNVYHLRRTTVREGGTGGTSPAEAQPSGRVIEEYFSLVNRTTACRVVRSVTHPRSFLYVFDRSMSRVFLVYSHEAVIDRHANSKENQVTNDTNRTRPATGKDSEMKKELPTVRTPPLSLSLLLSHLKFVVLDGELCLNTSMTERIHTDSSSETTLTISGCQFAAFDIFAYRRRAGFISAYNKFL